MSIFKRKKVLAPQMQNDILTEERICNLEKRLNSKEECNVEVLIKLNQLLQFMTQLDYAKDMILDVNNHY